MFNQPFIENQVPVKYRKPKHIAWLVSLMSHARKINDEFVLFRDAVRVCIRFNSQSLSLQRWLRNHFDNATITIVDDSNLLSSIYVFWLFESQLPRYLFWLSEEPESEYIYWLEEEVNRNLFYDFTVQVPQSLEDHEPNMRAQINKLKLAGKRYRIVYFPD